MTLTVYSISDKLDVKVISKREKPDLEKNISKMEGTDYVTLEAADLESAVIPTTFDSTRGDKSLSQQLDKSPKSFHMLKGIDQDQQLLSDNSIASLASNVTGPTVERSKVDQPLSSSKQKSDSSGSSGLVMSRANASKSIKGREDFIQNLKSNFLSVISEGLEGVRRESILNKIKNNVKLLPKENTAC